VAPILLPPSRPGPVDLLLMVDRRWARAGDAVPALLPLDYDGRITAAADLPGGGLIALDAEKGVVLVATRDAVRPAVRLTRVHAPTDVRLTLGMRLDRPGLSVVGYSVASGQVFGGALDLGRAEVAPIEALGMLREVDEMGAGACTARGLSQRFVAEIPVLVRVEAGGGRGIADDEVEATALVAGGGGRLCAEGVEARLDAGGGLEIRAQFGAKQAAVVRGRGGEARARCGLEPAGGAP
jgi:hypothetical protein